MRRRKRFVRRSREGKHFSGVACRDASYVTFTQLENKKLGIIIETKCNGKFEQRAVIACVDDAIFCVSGEKSERKMQEIVSCHMKTHEATGGKVKKT